MPARATAGSILPLVFYIAIGVWAAVLLVVGTLNASASWGLSVLVLGLYTAGTIVLGKANDSWLVAVYAAVLGLAVAMTAAGAVALANGLWSSNVLVAGLTSLVVVGATAPIAFTMHAPRERREKPSPVAPASLDHLAPHLEELQRSIDELRDAVTLGEQARAVVFPDRERHVLRSIVEQYLAMGEVDAAERLAEAIEHELGYPEDAAACRDAIAHARESHFRGQAQGILEEFDAALGRRDWGAAYRAAARIRELNPEARIVSELDQRIAAAREQQQRDLEHQFIDASERDDVEEAMAVLRELDRYMTREEAERLGQRASSIVTRHRERLGTAFRLAVQERRWADAARTGNPIIEEYPNTKMADEVRSMIDLIRTRATQAALTAESEV